MKDLSLNDTVEERDCDFVGCQSCPYNVRGFKTHGCILENGFARIHTFDGLALLCELNSRELFASLDEVPWSSDGWQTADEEDLEKLVERMRPIIAAAKKLVAGDWHYLKPEYEDKARKLIPDYIEEASLDGVVKVDIARTFISAASILEFFEKALAIERPVDFGKYDTGFIDRWHDEQDG